VGLDRQCGVTAGEDQPESVVVDGAEGLGRVVVVHHLGLLVLVVAFVSRRIRSMALRLAVVVGQAPSWGNTFGQSPLDGGRERLGRHFLGDVEVTEPPGQDGDHSGPPVVVGPAFSHAPL
jgi:hypothetical protein